jgi:hypothetical protein
MAARTTQRPATSRTGRTVIILDSNLLIYAARPEYPQLREWLSVVA